MAEIRENVIEWCNGDKYIACTFNQRRFISKIKSLRERYPHLVTRYVENRDGSIFCRIPLKALKLYLIGTCEDVGQDEDIEYEEEEDDEDLS